MIIARFPSSPPPQPALEHEQGPQRLPVVTTPGEVIVDQSGHERGIEESLAAQLLGRELVAQRRRQGLAHPARHRHGEALLAAIQDLVGQAAAHGPLENVLGRAPAQAQVRRQAAREVDQRRVEEGRAHLQADRARRAVHLGVDVVGQIEAGVEVEQAIPRATAGPSRARSSTAAKGSPASCAPNSGASSDGSCSGRNDASQRWCRDGPGTSPPCRNWFTLKSRLK